MFHSRVDANLSQNARNIYIRFVIKELSNTYLVNNGLLARKLNLRAARLNDFKQGRRSFSEEMLDQVENYIDEIYGPLIETFVPQNSLDEFQNFVLFLVKQEKQQQS
ncbi:hypothetical protein ACI3E1_07115 [Ligilactobacillus sp. LYQ139]|uniref:hypothetical protein n=1 Tax=Ligilactobacillus sp. LYQ139 TaxID=3378800 RepID=UPI003852E442